MTPYIILLIVNALIGIGTYKIDIVNYNRLESPSLDWEDEIIKEPYLFVKILVLLQHLYSGIPRLTYYIIIELRSIANRR